MSNNKKEEKNKQTHLTENYTPEELVNFVNECESLKYDENLLKEYKEFMENKEKEEKEHEEEIKEDNTFVEDIDDTLIDECEKIVMIQKIANEIVQGITQGIIQGLEKGKYCSLAKVAIKMIKNNCDKETIKLYTGLSENKIEEIENLCKQNNK